MSVALVEEFAVGELTPEQREWVDRAVAEAPPLSPEQREQIARLLASGVSEST